MKEEIFISSMLIMLLFNGFIVMVNPDVESVLNMDLASILITGLAVAITAGISVFGSGLSDSSTKIIFSVILIFNILFRVEIYGFTLGFGLVSTITDVFNNGDVLGFGTFIGGVLAFATFFSGLLIVVEGA